MRLGPCGLLLILSVATPQSGLASAAASHKIHVNLFGQPCVLQGPLEETALKLIHTLSPEQIYPLLDSPLSASPTQKALEKLRAITGAPTGLDLYRDRLTKRLEAQLALLEAADKYRKDHSAASILLAGKSHLTGPNQKKFEAAVKKADATKTLDKHDTFETIFDSYSEGIEPDPEEEFHRAIQRLQVQYLCSFEENGDGEPDVTH